MGDISWHSASYVARYCIKQKTGDQAEEELRRIDLDTGEEYYVAPEYITMSRNPGLASKWFERYVDDVYPDDFIVHNGKKFRPPKFYDNQLEKLDPQELETMKEQRRLNVLKHPERHSASQISARKVIQEKTQKTFSKRTL